VWGRQRQRHAEGGGGKDRPRRQTQDSPRWAERKRDKKVEIMLKEREAFTERVRWRHREQRYKQV
jgi:hypothetical protein